MSDGREILLTFHFELEYKRLTISILNKVIIHSSEILFFWKTYWESITDRWIEASLISPFKHMFNFTRQKYHWSYKSIKTLLKLNWKLSLPLKVNFSINVPGKYFSRYIELDNFCNFLFFQTNLFVLIGFLIKIIFYTRLFF